MMRNSIFLAIALSLFAQSVALADQQPTDKGPASASENAFVASMQADLGKRFATTADAEKAGYFRYTNADDTGAISYANLQWQSADPKHPSQLWYDKNGSLLGADFSVLYTKGSARPQLWGVNPGRWWQLDGHIHWIQTNQDTGKLGYDNYVMDNKFVAAGGSLTDPAAVTLVKMKKVASAGDVDRIFHFPGIWDLVVWILPNPNGAFAYKNPNVTM
jgi:hypothetical protein